MARRECTKVVVVPGIMGTELWMEEIAPSRVLRHRPIWGGDLNVIWHSLAIQPGDLVSPNVKPGKVLRYLTGFPFPFRAQKYPIYGPLFEHLNREYGLQEGNDLLEFGYDWRACNIESSKALAEFLRTKTDEADQVTLIAHSMGALICRAFLANAKFAHLHPRVRRVITMGAPVLGSPKAFYTLKTSPKIHALFDLVLKRRQRRDLKLYKLFMDSLATFQSLYQLLPPATEQIVFDEAGTQYSALNQELWSSAAAPLLKGAEALHGLLTGLSSDKLFALYSTKVPTERAYLIDASKQIMAPFQPLVLGDGTVTIASASAATVVNNRISFGSITHDSLPTSDEVLRKLEGLL